VRPDATDTVKKELTLDAVATAEDIHAGEDEVMHEIEHLAEDSEREPQEIAETMRENGTYALLEEEISRARALDFLVENAAPAPMPEEADEASVQVEAGGGATENEEREEDQ
jgi:trigger factor